MKENNEITFVFESKRDFFLALLGIGLISHSIFELFEDLIQLVEIDYRIKSIIRGVFLIILGLYGLKNKKFLFGIEYKSKVLMNLLNSAIITFGVIYIYISVF